MSWSLEPNVYLSMLFLPTSSRLSVILQDHEAFGVGPVLRTLQW
jgi:hypothetical protein